MGNYLENLILLSSIIISFLATIYVRVNYSKYKSIRNKSKLTGFDAARIILDNNNLKDMLILETSGELSDHYDPNKKVVKLSHDVYNGDSIASVSIAAHEASHAIDDKNNYKFLIFRNKMFPLVRFSSYAGYISILIGVIFSIIDLCYIGVAFEIIVLIFQLVTLPVEINASKNALKYLDSYKIVNKIEQNSVRSMLMSAALTYVASVLTSLLNIIRLLVIIGGRDD